MPRRPSLRSRPRALHHADTLALARMQAADSALVVTLQSHWRLADLNMVADPFRECPCCFALVAESGIEQHRVWHRHLGQ